MKFIILLLTGFSLGLANHLFAEPLAVRDLPSSSYPDTEVSTNITMRTWDENVRGFAFSLELAANTTNSLMVSFGLDRNSDGNLSEEEIGMTAGWDTGEWIIESKRNDERSVWPESSDGSVKRFAFDLMMRKSGDIKNAQIKSDNVTVYSSESNFPNWFYEKEWNLAKVIARGKDVSADRIKIDVTVPGFHLILR